MCGITKYKAITIQKTDLKYKEIPSYSLLLVMTEQNKTQADTIRKKIRKSKKHK